MTRLILRLYPPSFRARYGAELDALVDDFGGDHSWDLLRGAARAWLRPSFTGPDAVRRRRQATAATVWVAWCAGMLVAPTVNRSLLDPPVRGVSYQLLDAAQSLFWFGWARALVGAAPLMLRTALPALRRRDWPALRPLLPGLALAFVVAVGLGVLALVRRAHPADWPHPSVLFLTVGGLWLLSFLAFVVALGLGPATTLVRLAPERETLRLPALLAVPLTIALVALAAVSLAAVAAAGYAGVFGAVGIAVACGAALVALVSTARGVRAR